MRRRLTTQAASLLVAIVAASCATTSSPKSVGSDEAASITIPEARAGTFPKRWEYLCLSNPGTAHLDEAGAKGWEMVAISKGPRKAAAFGTNVLICFRRALPDGDASPGSGSSDAANRRRSLHSDESSKPRVSRQS